MADEKIYEWDVAREGDESPPYVFEVTRETIANYCKAVRYDNPVYLDDTAARAAGFPGVIAPPTMCYTYAPMRRVDLVAARGYVAPEQSANAPRSTPFVASEITFLGAVVRPGDVISSTTSVQKKWERKGNRFITFLIRAGNQRGETVAEYTYSCIWEYAKGRKVPEDVTAKSGASERTR
jgi:acyl dehydratase